MARKIPRINVSKLTDRGAGDRRATVATFGDSLRELGFVRVEGHGIDGDLIRRVYGRFEEFFGSADDEKARVAGGARGFTPFGVEHAKDSPVADLKEFFHVGQEVAPGRPLHGVYPPNLWPSRPTGLRADSLALYRALERVAITLLEALAEYFGMPDDSLASLVVDGNSVLRVLHYPPIPPDADRNAVRAAEHEDINLLTLLPEATDSGLEILTREGEWLPVVAKPGELVVDSGDMMARLTNDIVPSTTHRVVNIPEASTRDRYSMPFFVHPRPEVDLSVMEAFVTADRPARYPSITAGAFLDERLRAIGLDEEDLA